MRVKNIENTSNDACGCPSWKHHWKKSSGQSGDFCAVADCSNLAEVGAHVQRQDKSADRYRYIAPLCKFHNAQAGQLLDISDSTVLVLAASSISCGI
jgi:hypothetical protein